MNKREFYDYLVSAAMKDADIATMRPVVEKEILHYDILRALSEAGILRTLTFQGGTALRLCYGSHRYSEDLDFTGGVDFEANEAAQIKELLEAYLHDQYGLPVSVKEPVAKRYDNNNATVSRWQVAIDTAPERRDLPKQKIKLEIVNVPSHTKTPRLIQANYRLLPQGTNNLIIPVQTLEEIMADKLLGFAESLGNNATKPPRYRDLWDLTWMSQRQSGVDMSAISELITRKMSDYGSTQYEAQLDSAMARIPEIVNSPAFTDTMSRFLPVSTLDKSLRKDGFLPYLQGTVIEQMQSVKNHLYGHGHRHSGFTM